MNDIREYATDYLRKLPPEQVLSFAQEMIQCADPKWIDQLLGDKLFYQLLEGKSEENILELLRDFEYRSLSGAYYQPFFLDARSMTYTPSETILWFSQISRWLEYGCAQADAGNYQLAWIVLDACIKLLDALADQEIVFGDEVGDWMLSTTRDFEGIFEKLTPIVSKSINV